MTIGTAQNQNGASNPSGARPRLVAYQMNALDRTLPRIMPIADPANPSTSASPAIIFRTWPGVTPTARCKAISRNRC
jgi:hypothetical protein